MPAVTVENPVTLPRVSAPADAVAPTRAHRHDRAQRIRGRGLPGAPGVRRRRPAATLDPFIMMDQMGEVDYAPGEPKGTPWHPHRGFETVTYIIDGDLRPPGLATAAAGPSPTATPSG